VAHTCNPSYSGGGDREDCSSREVQAKKLARSPSQSISQMWYLTPVIPPM
jgi:hypothetical protein